MLREMHDARFEQRYEQRFEPRVGAMPAGASVPDTLLALRDRAGLACLDSAGGRPAHYSWVAWNPVSIPQEVCDLHTLGVCLGDWSVAGSVPGPFQGGFLGAFAYDLGVAGEGLDLPKEPWGWPHIIGGIYTHFVVFDHRAERAYCVTPDDAQGAAEHEHLMACLASGRVAKPFGVGALKRHTSREEHMRRIEVARGEIAAGDYYQVNLAHRFTAPMQGDPLDLYLRLRLANAAPYGGYLRCEHGACLSSSPELLLHFDGTRVFTRPIKGTAPRFADEATDRASIDTLRESAKDRAELAMIVDLERNDLGRIAQVGSVRVQEFPELESYARVHHLVATVEAQPRPGVGAIELLESLFPGGSITGAPKLASMEAIARLEGEGRGFFTGSLGTLDFEGHAAFNILIRTLLWRPLEQDRGELSFRVGGGITYASQALAEDEETLHKARGMMDAWGSDTC